MIKNYIIFSVIFLVIDAFYLNLSANYFNNQVKIIQGENLQLNMISTVLCYLFLTTGIFYFAIIKNLSITECFFLGLFVYGVFETTSHAIFKKWKYKTILMDTVWGGVLFASSVYAYKNLVNYI